MPYKDKEVRKQFFKKHDAIRDKTPKRREQRRIICNRFRQKRYEILRQLKSNGCAICGYNKYQNALDFHHVNPEDKLFNVNEQTVHNHSLSKVLEEIDKCILLCKNCHCGIGR